MKQFSKHWTGAAWLRHWPIMAVFQPLWLFQPFKCCCYNLIVPCGHWRRPPVTWKQLPSLALGNDLLETNVGEFPEVTATAGGCSNCWKLWRLLEAAANAGSCDGLPARPAIWRKMLFLFLLLFFPYISNTPRSQRESCLFSTWVISVSINRMLISQLKRFLGVKFMFPHWFNV